MPVYKLENQQISIQVNTKGAELQSLKKAGCNTEYMWQADPAYWKRTSPVLFPLVGGLRGGSYLLDGKRYPMGQHGFARDMEFQLAQQNSQEIWFRLESCGATKEIYPYDFVLEIGYTLQGGTLSVTWKVSNPSDTGLYFSIGGHPAFCCPLVEEEQQEDYYLWFDAKDKVTAGVIEGGLITTQTVDYTLDHGRLPITGHLFDKDALVIEHNQAHQVALVRPDGTHYVTVSFDAPLFGVWSVPGKKAPFVCIEPWYGRCDALDFTGTWQEREWGQYLQAGGVFEVSYQIEINS